MKKKILFLSLASAALLSSAAYAGQVSLSDAALADISGKDNVASFATTNIAVTNTSGNNDVQVAFYQWDDNHGADSSQQKGGASANGNNSHVQAGVSALNNVYGWGWAGQYNTTVGGSITNKYTQTSWCAMYVGGY
ncbi:MAG: hypothetical protein P8164_07770 [Gammaproteobacteria bacterium]|jgi:hypothetical protein